MSSEGSAQLLEQIKDKFRRLDVNGDGKCEQCKIVEVLKSISIDLTPADIEKLVGTCAASRDGVVNYAEFCDWLCGVQLDTQSVNDEESLEDTGLIERLNSKRFTRLDALDWIQREGLADAVSNMLRVICAQFHGVDCETEFVIEKLTPLFEGLTGELLLKEPEDVTQHSAVWLAQKAFAPEELVMNLKKWQVDKMKVVQKTEEELKAEEFVEGEKIARECTFTFLDAEWVRNADIEAMPRYRDLLAIEGALVELKLNIDEAYRGKYLEDVVTVSHRWETPEIPDVDGVQFREIQEFLRSAKGKQKKLLWYDFSCLPQGKRTKAQLTKFRWMLQNANVLYLSTEVLILLDISYLSRFWTQFEAWLAMQKTTSKGLEAAVPRKRRCTIKCIHNASNHEKEKLETMWATKRPQEAKKVLGAPDVTLTCAGDRFMQFQKIDSLEFEVQNAFGTASACALLQNGEVVSCLSRMGFGTDVLQESIPLLQRLEFSASQLKDLGFDCHQLHAVGYDPRELKDVGFSASEIKKVAVCQRLSVPLDGVPEEDLKKALKEGLEQATDLIATGDKRFAAKLDALCARAEMHIKASTQDLASLDADLEYRPEYIYENGATYTGQWRGTVREGIGVELRPDGTMYHGQWVNGKAEGKGCLVHADGGLYEGHWKNNKRHGKGHYTDPDGSPYEGQWQGDKAHGEEIEVGPDGANFIGQYIEGLKALQPSSDHAKTDGLSPALHHAPISMRNLMITNLCAAAAGGRSEEVWALLQARADVNNGDYDHRCPLHLASEEGHLDVVKMLVEQGADVNVADRWGTTPLRGSVANSRKEIAEFLRRMNSHKEIAELA